MSPAKTITLNNVTVCQVDVPVLVTIWTGWSVIVIVIVCVVVIVPSSWMQRLWLVEHSRSISVSILVVVTKIMMSVFRSHCSP